mmetsp:Transcript_47734/g.101439  ORF Transcript_47734/g.101439 Transcript_47734/m.101439 type:complete len:212 (+) Transcript_47734:127-762(+)|eukprot:CAMPEP_0172551792 /NCGR_PEP_ID=MMETSP1067-20121228/41066_1 /TAXON_ID=265564 ORGANISM="Thalassiosira punctigera, Strain Tpunct2005C2" /NCGR_SAMPLE_ID=MMETSP1067 /ASSEMBLY_ACC=CAM_ASM_000444 /LENGTH=211 /DNA_ID=CAMNT_0013339627 /DNA_START=88 /DNA_END=723 /DNA_ORIENTATION=+
MITKASLLSILLAQPLANAFAPLIFTSSLKSTSKDSSALHAENGIWNTAGSFGKGKFRFYEGFESYMEPFPDEDRQLYPEMFKLPEGVYEVKLAKPCGILFEEIEPNRGVYIQDLVDGGNAARQGVLQNGDVLVGMTAVQISGAKWERRLIPARKFGFDLVVSAIGSNEEKWGCNNVILMVERPGEADAEEVEKFLAFFEPPADTPWKLPV